MPPDGFKVYQTRPGPTEDITDQLQNGQPWLHSSKDALLTRNGNTLKALMFEAGIAVEGSVNLYSGDYYMNVRMKVPPTYGSRPRGFCGSPDGNNRNELYARNATSPILPPYSDRQLYPYLLTCKWISVLIIILVDSMLYVVTCIIIITTVTSIFRGCLLVLIVTSNISSYGREGS